MDKQQSRRKVALFGCEDGIWQPALSDQGIAQEEVAAVADTLEWRALELAAALDVPVIDSDHQLRDLDIQILVVAQPYEEALLFILFAQREGIEVFFADGPPAATELESVADPRPERSPAITLRQRLREKGLIARRRARGPYRVAFAGCSGSSLLIEAAGALGDAVVEVVAVYDPILDVAERVAWQNQVPYFHGSFRELLRRRRPDGVIVAAEARMQCELTLAALDAECDVFCVPPVGQGVWDLGRMIHKARRVGRVLEAGYLPPVQLALDRKRDGFPSIGTPELIEARVNRSPDDGPSVEWTGWLLSAALPILDAPPVAVAANGWKDGDRGGVRCRLEEARRISLVVRCENGARGTLAVDVSEEGIENAASIRCAGSAGIVWRSVPMTPEFDGDSCSSFRDRRGFRARGTLPTTPWRTAVAQFADWVRMARDGDAEGPQGPRIALDVHTVLAAASASAIEDGREVEI